MARAALSWRAIDGTCAVMKGPSGATPVEAHVWPVQTPFRRANNDPSRMRRPSVRPLYRPTSGVIISAHRPIIVIHTTVNCMHARSLMSALGSFIVKTCGGKGSDCMHALADSVCMEFPFFRQRGYTLVRHF